MKSLINIHIDKSIKGNHKDLILEIPQLISKQTLDTYYFFLTIEPKYGVNETENAIGNLLVFWIQKLKEINNGETIYLPIDFSDQGTGCLKIIKNNKLNVSYGHSRREGWSVDPIKPNDYYKSITDFSPLNSNRMIVNQTEFEHCLDRIIEEMKN